MKERVSNVFMPLTFALKYLKKERKILYLVAIVSASTAIFRLLVPIYFGDAVTSVEKLDLSSVEYFAILVVVVSALSAVTQFIVNYGSQYLSQRYAFELRNDTVHRLLNKRFPFFEQQTSGNLLSRCTMDIEATRNFVLASLAQLIPTVFLIVISVYFLATLDPVYLLFFVFVVPLLIYLGIRFQKKQRGHWRTIRDTYGIMNERLQENITGQRLVRGFLAEGREVEKFENTTNAYFSEYNVVAKLRGKYNNIMPLLISAAATGVIIVGGYTSIIAATSVGSLVSAVTIFNTLTFPVSFLGRLIVWSENARAGIDRIADVIKSDLDEETGVLGDQVASPPVEASKLTFTRDKKQILNRVGFRLRKGELVAITGATGSGKSTFINMIPRFYDPDSGMIEFDGKESSSFSLSELRGSVAIVPQEISLLSGSIRENIAFGNGEFTEEEIIEAARIAHIDDFIQSLPEKYETAVGERGITLSGGQKQRVAIARAVIMKPEILIFDDATSSLDAETEIGIFRSIKEELRDTSTIIISFRESGLGMADRVVKLENGEFVDHDTSELEVA